MHTRTTNPYYNTACIDDPEMFFGRAGHIEIILNSLFSDVPQCISIVGQRKVGKSSLVAHISRESTIRAFNFDPSGFVFVYFDCQKYSHALTNASDVYTALLSILRESVPADLKNLIVVNAVDKSFVGDQFERALRVLREKAVTVIIMLDEFDKAVSQETLVTEGLFGSLRGYTQANRNFAWITCTNRPLYELFEEAFDEFGITTTRRKSESDFYNIAPMHVLRLFELNEAEDLMELPFKKYDIPLAAEDRKLVVDLGGTFPYFVQRSCYHLFQASMQGGADHADIRAKCIEEFGPLWNGYWNKLDTSRRKTLYEIAVGSQNAQTRPDVELLRDGSMIRDDEPTLRAFSEEFRRFVLSKREEIQLIDTPSAPRLMEEIGSLKNQLQTYKEKAHAAEERYLHEVEKGTTVEGRNKAALKKMRGAMKSRSLTIRWLLGVIVSLVGIGALFVIPALWHWQWLAQHPKQRGIYICSVLVILGFSWMIVDPKRWISVLLYVVVAAILVFIQIN